MKWDVREWKINSFLLELWTLNDFFLRTLPPLSDGFQSLQLAIANCTITHVGIFSLRLLLFAHSAVYLHSIAPYFRTHSSNVWLSAFISLDFVTDLLRTFRQPTVTRTHAPRSFIFQNSLWKLQRRRRDFPCDHAKLCDFTLLSTHVITVDFKCQKGNEKCATLCDFIFATHWSDSDRTPDYHLFVWRSYS